MTKWEIDWRHYRTPIERRQAAERFGMMSVAHILTITSNASGQWEFPLPEIGLDRAEQDAVMFARMAFRGWRALQMVDHEVN